MVTDEVPPVFETEVFAATVASSWAPVYRSEQMPVGTTTEVPTLVNVTVTVIEDAAVAVAAQTPDQAFDAVTGTAAIFVQVRLPPVTDVAVTFCEPDPALTRISSPTAGVNVVVSVHVEDATESARVAVSAEPAT